MKIKSIRIYNIKIPFTFPVRHAKAEMSVTSSLVVKLTMENKTTGFGECLPRDYVTGETIESTIEKINHLFSIINKCSCTL